MLFSIWMIFAQQTQTFQIEMDAVFRVDIHYPGYPNKRISNNVNNLIIGYPTDKNFKWNSYFKDYTIPVVIFFLSEQPHCKRFCRCYSRRPLWPLSSLLPPTTTSSSKVQFFSLLRTFRSQINTTPSTLLWLLAIAALWRDAGGKIAKVDSH